MPSRLGYPRHRVNQAGGAVVAVVLRKDLASSFDALPSFVWRVIYCHEDLHEYSLLFEVNALFGKGLGVLLFEDEAHFFG